MKSNVLIIGAGPAGLTAAYELLRTHHNVNVTILEKESSVGGLAKTINHDGNLYDLGGHRYFSNEQSIITWWRDICPLQTIPRHSSILFKSQRINYPLQLSFDTLRILGFRESINVIWDYLKSRNKKTEAGSLRDFYVSRFGNRLYSLFFKDYTRKVCGVDPESISQDWGYTRVKSVSLAKAVISPIVIRIFGGRAEVDPSMTGRFLFPSHGSGDLWKKVSLKILEKGGQVRTNANAVRIHVKNKSIHTIEYESNGRIHEIKPDLVISTMPVKDLCQSFTEIPENILNSAKQLEYRSMILVSVLLEKASLVKDDSPLLYTRDQWLYVQNKNVEVGRIQIWNNWTPTMLRNPEKYLSISMEFFCNNDDDKWNRTLAAWQEVIYQELHQLKLIVSRKAISRIYLDRVPNAYPGYWGHYSSVRTILDYLDSHSNLVCIGRNGRHSYINMDEVTLNAIEAVRKLTFEHK